MYKYLPYFLLSFVILVGGCTIQEECCEVDTTQSLAWPVGLQEKTVQEPELERAPLLPAQEEIPEEVPALVDEIREQEPAVPELACAIEGNNQAVATVPHELDCVTSNKSDANVEVYTLTINLPTGVTFDDGQSSRTMEFEGLTAQSNSPYPFRIVASAKGEYNIKAEVSAPGVSPATSEFLLVVQSPPSVKMELSAPAKVNLEGAFEYKISLANNGEVDLHDLLLQDKIDSEKLIYVSSTPEGSYDAEKGVVTWKFDQLAKAETKEFRIKATTVELGTIVNKARVNSREKARQQAELQTEITTVAGLRQDHYDTQDPVEVGATTTYVIEILNQGAKEAKGINLTDTIPEESEFVEASTEGLDTLVKHRIDGRKVIFDPIERLASGESVKFKVTVRVTKVGSLLNTVEVTTQDFDKSLKSQEGTTSYPNEEQEKAAEAENAKTETEKTDEGLDDIDEPTDDSGLDDSGLEDDGLGDDLDTPVDEAETPADEVEAPAERTETEDTPGDSLEDDLESELDEEFNFDEDDSNSEGDEFDF